MTVPESICEPVRRVAGLWGWAAPNCSSRGIWLRVPRSFRPIGACSCEHFAFRLQANLAKIPPHHLYTMSQGDAAKLRCTHIEAARALALDLTVEQHERGRHAAARGQREGQGA